MILLVTRKIKFEVENKKLLIFLGLSNGVAYLLQYLGMNYTSAAKASLFVNLTAIWVALLSTFLINERINKRKMVAVIFGIIGVVFVTTNLNLSQLIIGELFGDLLVILAGIVWAFFIIYNKKLMNNTQDSFQALVWILAITLLPMIDFTLPFVVLPYLFLQSLFQITIRRLFFYLSGKLQ